MLPPEPPAPENSPPPAAVDLPALAAKIYALLKEAVRLERERSGPRPLR